MSALQRIASYATVFILLCTALFTTTSIHAQAPEGINYQAVARNNSGDPLSNQIISVRFSVIANSTSGAVLYQEDHSAISTNEFGLFNLIIGQGSRTGGSLANFAAIDWSSGSRFLRVEVDAGSGFENLGTTQMLSVPYALYAKTSGSASNNLKAGNGIIIRNDTIINDGDVSVNNEIITAFSIEPGNVLRITEAATNWDIDLTPFLPTSTDDQNLSFSANKDSILIENGAGIDIQFILDDISNNAANILTNQSDITALITDLSTLEGNFNIDSTQTLENQDSIAILTTLIGNATDNQNLEIRNDSIVIDRGAGVDIEFLATDAKLSADSNLLGGRISTNETDVANLNTDLNTLEGNFNIDSTQTLENQDSIAILTTLIGNVTDNQNLSIVGDSLVIERGTNVGIGFIADSISDLRTSIEANRTDITTNQNDITALNTNLSTLQTNFTSDSTITLQNQDSIAILTTLIGNVTDNQNLSIVGDSIVIERGTNIGIGFITDSITNYDIRIIGNQTSAETNAIDIITNQNAVAGNTQAIIDSTANTRTALANTNAALRALIGNNNDTSVSNEIQQLSLIADQLRIDDPSGIINPLAIDLSIYNTSDNLGNHQLDSNLRLGAFYISGDGDNEGISIGNTGDVSIANRLTVNDALGTGFPLSINGNGTDDAILLSNSSATTQWDLGFLVNGIVFSEYLVAPRLTMLEGGLIGINTNTPDSALTVNGGLKTTYFTMTDGAASGSVLTSDANGVATWQGASGNGIYDGTGSLSGNTEVTQGANALSFTSTATNAFSIDTTTFVVDAFNNKIFIGTASSTTPASLEINGTGIFGAGLELRNGGRRFLITNRSTGLAFVKGDGVTTTPLFIEHSSSEIGVMTLIPAYNLDVNGTFSANSINVNDAYTLPNADGTAGQTLQTDGAGAVSWTSATATCPAGMTNVNGNICIETNERAASDWYDASQTCTSLGYKLPTWSEWYGAATNAVLTNETNNWEWVSDGTSNTARKVGNTNLKNTANDDPETGSANFRCIFYR